MNRKKDFLSLSPEEAKKTGQNYAKFLIGFKTELIQEGIDEETVNHLIETAVRGDCIKVGEMVV